MQLATVMKALCVLGIGELRWSARQLRASLVGCEDAALWRDASTLDEALGALYRHGVYVERNRREGEGADEYYIDVSSDASERIRQRLNELVREMLPEDSRVMRAALDACREDDFPLAGLAETRSISVEWWHARRAVNTVCRDLADLSAAELQNLAGTLESSATREDGWLFLASPLASPRQQREAWREAGRGASGRFAAGLVAWLPRELSVAEREHLVEHAALSRMANDPTMARPRDRELRAKLRERWEDSEAQIRRMLQSVFYDGSILAANGESAIEKERLASLKGQWEESLAAIFASAFRTLFPRFASIAPERRLSSRAQTNQIIDQFVRPGEVTLPPASALEANLAAYAAPLGLVEGGEQRYRLSLRHRELVQAAVAAAPKRQQGGEIDPGEVIAFSELAGRLAKSEWGVTREQCELLVAALIRHGYLVALDAFLQPVRLDVIAAPLAENLPYIMRGSGLGGKVGEAARGLWAAVIGREAGSCSADWDLPAQESAWAELVAWSEALRPDEAGAGIASAAAAFGHSPDQWAWAEEALACVHTVARCVDRTATSQAGMAKLAEGSERLPGGTAAVVQALGSWRACAGFLRDACSALAQLSLLVRDERAVCASGSLLARERELVLRALASPERLVAHSDAVRAAAHRWLDSYRKHYLAWHSAAYAPARYEGLARLRQSATLDAAQRLTRAGIPDDQADRIASAVAAALGQRCLAGDPLPTGWMVCPSCGLRLGQEVTVSAASEMTAQAEAALARQVERLRDHGELFRRRLGGCRDERVVAAVEILCTSVDAAEELRALLSDDVIAWIRAQLGQPRAQKRELAELEGALRGKEMTKREVVQRVDEWLGGGEDEVVEVV